jgi:hypothetical protein
MSASLLMNRSMKFRRDVTWLILAPAISLPIFTGSLSTRPRISSTQSVRNIQMRRRRSAKSMIYQKINGLRFVIWRSQDIIILWRSTTAGIFMLLVVGILWMRHLLNPSNDWTDMPICSSRNGSQYQLSTKIMHGLLVIRSAPSPSTIPRSWFSAVTTAGSVIASISIQRPMLF